MRAAILSIGDELTLGESLDTNSKWLAEQLAQRAIEITEHRTIGDDQAAIAQAIKDYSRTCNIIIATGGLGPTADDLTRAALNDAISPHEPLVQDEAALDHLRNIFERRGRTMPETNLVQALRPRSARMLPNPKGTAMGLAAKVNTCDVYCLPGPPREMMPMFEHHVATSLPVADDNNTYITRSVHAFGIGESDAAQRLGDLLARGRDPQLGITVSDATLTIRIRARGKRSEIMPKLEADSEQVEKILFPYAFARDECILADCVGKLLTKHEAHLTTAESCTGGLLGKMIVDVAGSSSHYCGGWVTYSNELKTRCLNVPAELINSKGAVSSEVAIAMAEGALDQAKCDYALSITGVAGPDGGTPAKPVGTVFIGLASRGKDTNAPRSFSRRFLFPGERADIRERSAKCALQLLRFELLGLEAPPALLWEMRPKSANPSEPMPAGAQSKSSVQLHSDG